MKSCVQHLIGSYSTTPREPCAPRKKHLGGRDLGTDTVSELTQRTDRPLRPAPDHQEIVADPELLTASSAAGGDPWRHDESLGRFPREQTAERIADRGSALLATCRSVASKYAQKMASDAAGDLRISLGSDHVATVEVVRPPENYLDVDLVRALADQVEALEADTSCRAIVLCSAGKHFCAGARLTTDATNIPTTGINPLYLEAERLFTGAIPIVACVQGSAIGAGLGLALAADFRVASPETRFAASFARLGFHHGFGLSATLPHVIGSQRALDMLYTGRRVHGPEALEIGLCDRLVPAESLRDEATALAHEITSSAPLAVRAIRRTMRAGLVEEFRRATRIESEAQSVLKETDDYREGVTAAAERREPRFLGR